MNAMKSTSYSILFLLMIYFLPTGLVAQCTGGNSGGALSPIPTSSTQAMSVMAGRYYTFNVTAQNGCAFATYIFSFCPAEGGSAGINTEITILDNSGTPVAGGYNNDFCGLSSQVTWTPTAAGTYRVLINQFQCGNGGGSIQLGYRMILGAAGNPFGLVNDATIGGTANCVQLTAAANNQIGCAWDLLNPVNFANPFTREFMINLGSNNGGADGMTFVFQADPNGTCACGFAGGSLGASGITNSLIIEIDTYLNSEDRDDGLPGVLCSGGPDPDHLDIWLNGNINPPGICGSSPGARIIPAAVPLMNGASSYDIENGLNHLLRITWSGGATGTLTATVLNAAGTITYGSVSHTFSPLTLFGTNSPNFGFSASTGGLNNAQSFCYASPVLANRILNFSAAVQNRSVLLDWQLEGDGEIAQFIVQRSSNGSLFFDIGSMSSKKSGEMVEAYIFEDRNLPDNDEAYYQLKLMFQDGSMEFSEIVKVDLEEQGQVQLYPNPTFGMFYVHLPEAVSAQDAALFDMQGRVVRTFHFSGPGTQAVDVSSLAKGVYLFKLEGHAMASWQKLHIQ